MGYRDLSQHGNRYNINTRIMVAAVLVLFAVVLFVFLLHLYARWVWRYSRRRSVRSRLFYFAEEQDPLRLRNVGLDPKVREMLPMFVYNAENNSSPLECAVCLSEFQENEKGRILPKCKHCFHTECIDMWFHSHSTCPLCRTSARPEDLVADKVEEEVAPSPHPDLETVCVERGQTSSVEGESRRREMPQIVIDIPKRTDSFSSPRDLGQVYSPNGSAKSPVSHLRSLSRMLSRDRDRDRKVFPDVEGGDGDHDQE